MTTTAIDGSVQRIDNMMGVERQQFEPVKRTDFSFESFCGISILHKLFFSSVEIEKECDESIWTQTKLNAVREDG